LRTWYLYLVHICAATIGSMAYSVFPVVHFVDSALSFSILNRVLSHPSFPLQILAGLMMGYLSQFKYKSNFARWVWTIPLAIWIYQFASFSSSSVFEDLWQARIRHFIGSGCRPPACFDQMRYTAPVYTSAAYSLGAILQSKGWLGRLAHLCRFWFSPSISNSEDAPR